MTKMSTEQKKMKKVFDVFATYIEGSPHFDVLFSYKIGYLFITLNGETGEFLEADLVEDAEDLCSKLYYEAASDVFDELPDPPEDIWEVTEDEKKLILDSLAPYRELLPQYEHLVDNLFVRPQES